jgi:MFS family permease
MGMDRFIYALVQSPALTELLPESGTASTHENVGLASPILFALFRVGRSLSFLWGNLADHFGRTRALAPTVFAYALFTGAAVLAFRTNRCRIEGLLGFESLAPC